MRFSLFPDFKPHRLIVFLPMFRDNLLVPLSMIEQSKTSKLDPISSQKSEDLIYTAPESEILQLAMTQRHMAVGHDIHRHYCRFSQFMNYHWFPKSVCTHNHKKCIWIMKCADTLTVCLLTLKSPN